MAWFGRRKRKQHDTALQAWRALAPTEASVRRAASAWLSALEEHSDPAEASRYVSLALGGNDGVRGLFEHVTQAMQLLEERPVDAELGDALRAFGVTASRLLAAVTGGRSSKDAVNQLVGRFDGEAASLRRVLGASV